MLLDKQALFSDDQAITATAASTNYMNLGATDTVPGAPAALVRDIGGANAIEILVQVPEHGRRCCGGPRRRQGSQRDGGSAGY